MPITSKELLKRSFTVRKLDLQESVARDNLANERTYLAWVRTGFAIAALGVVISRSNQQLGNDDDKVYFKVLSLLFISIGLLSMVCGSIRFSHVEYLMEQGKYPTAGLYTTIVTIFGIVSFIATLVIIII